MEDKIRPKLSIPAGGIKKASITLLGKVEKTTKERIYAVKEKAVVGKQYIVICPACGKPILVKASEPVVFRAMHKTCNMPIIIRGVAAVSQEAKQTEEIHERDKRKKGSNSTVLQEGIVQTSKNVVPGSKTNAKLSWWSFTGRKQFVLRMGKNYVGRRDEENPSNLSLKDAYASAKSICIDVNRSARGYTFHLTVEHATNPVLINGKEQPEGSSFDLNYGDIIRLGNTTLTFNPVKR